MWTVTQAFMCWLAMLIGSATSARLSHTATSLHGQLERSHVSAVRGGSHAVDEHCMFHTVYKENQSRRRWVDDTAKYSEAVVKWIRDTRFHMREANVNISPATSQVTRAFIISIELTHDGGWRVGRGICFASFIHYCATGVHYFATRTHLS